MVATTRRALSPVLALLLLLPMLAVWPSTPADAADFDNTDRIAASDYTATGIAVSKRVFANGAHAAVLTRDDHFPDALAASALAASVNGPVLFTDTDRLTGSTATELNRVLDPGDTVYITGGTAAVSEDVANEVRDQGYAVNRLAGKTRVETAAAIAESVGVPNSGRVLIARAFGPPGRDITTGWVDSVTCGAYANRTTTPVLLTGTGALDAPTAAALDEIGATDATICGGEAAVSAQAAEDLRDAGLDVDRVFGATRVETAVAVAEELFGYSSAAGHTYLLVNGYGDNFGWGLAATPLAGSLGAPILLVGSDFPTDCADEAQPARNTLCHLETAGGGQADVIGIGRTAQIGDAVLDAAAEAAGGNNARTSPPSGTLATPTGVSTSNVSTQSEGRVKVTWKPVDDDGRLAGYNVYYGTDSPDTRAGSSNPTVGPDTTSFTVGALQLNTTYRFAVTSVTNRGAESDRSATATETTTAPSVDLTSPTAAAPARVAPSTGLTVDLDYTASEGGTLQLFHRSKSGDTWKPFGDAFTAARSDGTIRSVNVTAPGEGGTYDLRARLKPSGSAPIHDVEIGALDVTKPKITLKKPTNKSVTEALPDTEGLEVVFDYDTNEDGTYVVALQGPDGSDGDWTDVAQGPAPAGHVKGETATFTAPTAEGFYNVRVRIETDAGDTHNRIEEGALYVVTPEISLSAPAEPTLAGSGQSFETAFQTNAGGDYAVQHRPAGTDEWMTFASDVDEAEGRVAAGGTRETDATPTVQAPSTTGSYDVSVVLDPNADPDNDIRTTAHDDESSPARLDVASLVLDAPTNGEPAKVEPGTDVTVTFTLDSPVEVAYWVETRPTGGEGWSDLSGQQTPGDTAGTPEGNEVTVSAPTDPDDYDLRVRVQPDTGSGEVVDVGLGALQVQSSPVDLTTPSADEPVEVDNDEGGATFSVTFDSEITGDYTIECSNDGDFTNNACDTNNTGTVGTARTTTVSGIDAPSVSGTHADNTYDVRVTVTPETGDPADDKVTGGLRVGHVDVISPDGNTYAPEETFTVEFDVNAAGDYEIQRRDDDSTSEADWQTMQQDGGGDAVGTVNQQQADDDESETHAVQAPDSTSSQTYALRVLFELGEEAVGGDKTVAGETTFSVDPNTSSVTVTLDRPDGETVAPGDPVPVQFTVTGLGEGATTDYTLEYRPDGSTDPSGWAGFGDDTDTGTAANGTNITAVTAPDVEDGLLDVRVVLDVGAEDVKEGALDVTSDDSGNEVDSGTMMVTITPDPTTAAVDELVTYTIEVGQAGGDPQDIRVALALTGIDGVYLPGYAATCDGDAGERAGDTVQSSAAESGPWDCADVTVTFGTGRTFVPPGDPLTTQPGDTVTTYVRVRWQVSQCFSVAATVVQPEKTNNTYAPWPGGVKPDQTTTGVGPSCPV